MSQLFPLVTRHDAQAHLAASPLVAPNAVISGSRSFPSTEVSWPNRFFSRQLGLFSTAVALLLPLANQTKAQVAAKPADSFVESIGVNTHWAYDTYSNYAGLKQKLADAGIRYIRDGSGTNNYSKYNELYNTYGIRTNVLLGRRVNGDYGKPLDLGQIDTELADVKSGISAAAIASLEDPNEYDISHGGQESDWVGKIRNYSKNVYAKAKADATLKNYTVIGPSFTDPGAYQSVGSLDASIDNACIHQYQSFRNPETGGWGDNGYGSIDWAYNYYVKVQSPSNKPVQATECGYHNDYQLRTWTNDKGESGNYLNYGLSEEAEGKYTARMFAEFYRKGIARSFKYELVNQGTDSKEDVFGLLRKDLTEKPSFKAVKNLISVLSDKGTSFTPGSLAYTLSGSTNNVRQQLFQKRNGDYYLMLWLGVASWDTKEVYDGNGKLIGVNNKDLYPAAQSVTLTLPSNITSATVYQLNDKADMTNAAASISNNAVSLSVSDKVMIVKLAAGTTTPPPTTGTFSGVYWLVARHSGKVLDVSATSQADGARAIQWPRHDGANQQWKVEATGDGYYKLTAQHSGKCLDVSGASGNDGAWVQQWTDNGSSAQRWKIEATSDGYYKLTAQCSGKVLDIAGGPSATADGTGAIQWGYGGGTNQQWKLEPVPSSAARTAASTASSSASLTTASSALQVYPNPNHGEATVGLEAASAQRVPVYVHDGQGQLVALITVPAQVGHTAFRLPTTLPPGTYFLKAVVDGRPQRFTLKVE